MWTAENRQRYNRDKLRYPSDLTDEEWSWIERLIQPAKRGGRRRDVDVREVLNGVMYVLSTGCQWRCVPKDLPPRSTLHGYLQRWIYDEKGGPALTPAATLRGSVRSTPHLLFETEGDLYPRGCVLCHTASRARSSTAV
jgi:Putative transposase of IS4/5 family (DUF4096)